MLIIPPIPSPDWVQVGDATHPTKVEGLAKRPVQGTLMRSVHTGHYVLDVGGALVSVPQSWARQQEADRADR